MNINEEIEKYKPLVKTVIWRYFPSEAKDEDIEQIGLIALWLALKEFKSENDVKFETFASRVIYRRIVNELKRRAAQKRGNNVITISISTNLSDEGNQTIEDTIVGANDIESYRDVSDFTKALNSLERKIINNKSKGLTDQEIAAITNLSRSSVTRRLQKMKREFRNKCIEGR